MTGEERGDPPAKPTRALGDASAQRVRAEHTKEREELAATLSRQAVQREYERLARPLKSLGNNTGSARRADETLRGLQEFLMADKKRVAAVPVDTALTQLRRVSLPNPIEYAETKASLDRLLTHEAKRRAARSSAAAEAEAAGAGSEVAARAKARALRTGRGERTGSGWSPSGVQVQKPERWSERRGLGASWGSEVCPEADGGGRLVDGARVEDKHLLVPLRALEHRACLGFFTHISLC